MGVETRGPAASELGIRLPDDFLERGTNPALRLVHDFVTDELISFGDVTSTLECLRDSPQVGPNLRVAVDGGYRQDMRQRVIDSDPAHDGEPLQSWADRLFGTDPFYVVVNELEVFNPALVRRVGRLLWPLIEAHARWFGGLSLALLIGRDGFSSFGVHRDRDCRWNLQFHLGPASKTMIVWDDDALEGAADADLLAVEPLLPRGDSFELQPGDLFVLPCRKQHAGRYTDLAVTLVASLRVGTARGLAEAAFRSLLDERARAAPLPEVGLSRRTADAADFAQWEIDGPAFERAVESERLRRWSNLGMTVRKPDALPAPSRLHGKVLSIVDPFPICWQALPGGRLWISARGHTLTIAHHARMLEILERLNAREKIRVEHDAPPTLLMLMAFLHSHDAVDEVSNDR